MYNTTHAFSHASVIGFTQTQYEHTPRSLARRATRRRAASAPRMCRWIFYYGEEVCISKLIYGASHGLATMADRAGWTPGCERDRERNHEVNVHGCGACDDARARALIEYMRSTWCLHSRGRARERARRAVRARGVRR